MEKLTSIWQIDERMVPEISSRDNKKSYYEELERLLNKYVEVLKDFCWGDDSSVYEKEKKEVDKGVKKLKEMFESYSKGKLEEGNRIAYNLFKVRANTSSAQALFPTCTIPSGKYWFRVRKAEDEKRFNRKGLFHVPFCKRNIIGTNRFSVPGYPCLYLGSSMECSREETGSPGIAAISCFRNNRGLRALDFTFYPDSSNISLDKKEYLKYLRNAVVSYPYKIAASIPTRTGKGHTDDKYQEEYIIPQLILHYVIKQAGKKPLCILYSSTKAIQKKIPKEEFLLHKNLVMPTFFSYGDYCSLLKSTFPLTVPEIVAFNYLSKEQLKRIEENMKKKRFEKII